MEWSIQNENMPCVRMAERSKAPDSRVTVSSHDCREHSGPRMWAWVRIPLLTRFSVEWYTVILSFIFQRKPCPPSRIWTSDLRIPAINTSTVLRSTNWAIGGDVGDRNWGIKFQSAGSTFTKIERQVCSRGWFRSTDLWVKGPARFLCATLLLVNYTPRMLQKQMKATPSHLHFLVCSAELIYLILPPLL